MALKPDLQKIGSFTINYIPQIGFLICSSKPPEDLMISEAGLFEFQFSADTDYFYKNLEMRGRSFFILDLDENIGDIHSEIMDIEIEIARDVQSLIFSAISTFPKLGNLIGELDCILSFSEVSKINGYSKPRISSRISLNKSRHPIQEQFTQPFIDNDFESDNSSNPMSILTGPNTSGKSIFMKQIALAVFMNQIGCFIPAGIDSELPVIDEIFARIQTRESVSKGKSAFQTDLEQVKTALTYCTKNSLILLDEFGKGTNSEGIGMNLIRKMEYVFYAEC